jgi:methylenetetrahydrofolate reductase (NADPH)
MSDRSPPRRHVSQFEVLPLERTEAEAARIDEPLQLTVTCSPRHGPDESVDVGRRLCARGHTVTPHVAARMVRDRAHLDALLRAMADARIEDLFLIGGDATPPHGPYSSAAELLPVICDHRHRPRTIGIAGYPEGHPQIDDETLWRALLDKAQCSDYVTTQLCFDPDAIVAWIDAARDRGLTLPVLVGVPGTVDRAKLLKMAVQIGVGSSLRFVRKQRGLRNLLGRSGTPGDRVFDALEPCLDDPRRNLMGFHYYTFNQLVESWEWEREKRPGATLPARSDVKEADTR